MFGRLARALLASLIADLGGVVIAAARRRLERKLGDAPEAGDEANPRALKKAPEAPVQLP
ncbi:MAG: hypothetical protein AB7E60_01860 [Sphingobium sp.]